MEWRVATVTICCRGNRVLRYGGEIVSVYIDLRWRERSVAGENGVYWVWYDDYIGPI